jgi:hypothetical protein
MAMLYRRHFLRSVMLILAPLALPVPTPRAQETYSRPEVKISELRPVVKRYIERLSQAYEKHTGVGFSEQEKKVMVEETISKLEAQRFYAYVDP